MTTISSLGGTVVGAWLGGAAMLLAASAHGQEACDAVEIDLLGAESGEAHALNNAGQVVGELWYESDATRETHAFVWQAGTTRRLAPLASGEDAGAKAINDQGVVVGWAADVVDGVRPAIWQSGVASRLPGSESGMALAINNNGQIAGRTSTRKCLFWASSTSDPVVIAEVCHPTSINNAGEVVGHVTMPDDSTRAFVWRAGVFVDAHTGPREPLGYGSSFSDINSAGLAVGRVTSREDGTRPIVRNRRGSTQVLRMDGVAVGVTTWGRIVVLNGAARNAVTLREPWGAARALGTLQGNTTGVVVNDRLEVVWNAYFDDPTLRVPYFCQLP